MERGTVVKLVAGGVVALATAVVALVLVFSNLTKSRSGPPPITAEELRDTDPGELGGRWVTVTADAVEDPKLKWVVNYGRGTSATDSYILFLRVGDRWLYARVPSETDQHTYRGRLSKAELPAELKTKLATSFKEIERGLLPVYLDTTSPYTTSTALPLIIGLLLFLVAALAMGYTIKVWLAWRATTRQRRRGARPRARLGS
jgi:hypothetical protein